ncbi:MAG: phosphatase [Acetivibrionales bacterium]|jgi:putative hydrolase|nr:phosphatase [Clostridiaceae bacterium]
MKLIADCHFHTVNSGHAYSTLTEYAKEASQKGLELIGMTDHGPAMPGGPITFHFDNLRVVPSHLFGVEILKGIEANILDYDGNLDTDRIDLSSLDVVISSFHGPCIASSTKKENTKAIIKSMENEFVNIIGHPDDSRVPLDYSELVKAAADTGVLLEMNNSSLKPGSYRLGAAANYEVLLEECYKNNVYIIVNSDAHFHADIGSSSEAVEIIKKMGFPEKLIANTSVDKLKQRLNIRRR